MKAIFLFIAMLGITSSYSQKSLDAMSTNDSAKNNPLLCDPKTGVCETLGKSSTKKSSMDVRASNQKIKMVYFTDPICSSCWGIEPQLRKLKLEYGDYLDIEYRMGGLLPDWSYNSGGISKPSDVAHHWDEVSDHYDMPIDGDVWLEDPLDSSYPPSIAYKAVQLQDESKAVDFMREIREMVFLKKINIAKLEHLATAAQNIGLDKAQFKKDFEGKAKTLFEQDLALAREYGVRGFPTIFFIDESGQKEMVYGSRPYAFYEVAILKLMPEAEKAVYEKDWESLFNIYPSLTAKEFSELSGMSRAKTETYLNDLVGSGKLNILTTKNGSMWSKK